MSHADQIHAGQAQLENMPTHRKTHSVWVGGDFVVNGTLKTLHSIWVSLHDGDALKGARSVATLYCLYDAGKLRLDSFDFV
jgi:hypothetical protein